MGETKEIERSVQMRLYALHKRQFVGVFAVFFICLFITLLIGIAGPSAIKSNNYKPDNSPKQLSGPYVLTSEFLDKFHQRLWLTMKASTDINDDFNQAINVTISMNDSSSPSTQPAYERQRNIRCQKRVSQMILKFF